MGLNRFYTYNGQILKTAEGNPIGYEFIPPFLLLGTNANIPGNKKTIKFNLLDLSVDSSLAGNQGPDRHIFSWIYDTSLFIIGDGYTGIAMYSWPMDNNNPIQIPFSSLGAQIIQGIQPEEGVGIMRSDDGKLLKYSFKDSSINKTSDEKRLGSNYRDMTMMGSSKFAMSTVTRLGIFDVDTLLADVSIASPQYQGAITSDGTYLYGCGYWTPHTFITKYNSSLVAEASVNIGEYSTFGNYGLRYNNNTKKLYYLGQTALFVLNTNLTIDASVPLSPLDILQETYSNMIFGKGKIVIGGQNAASLAKIVILNEDTLTLDSSIIFGTNTEGQIFPQQII